MKKAFIYLCLCFVVFAFTACGSSSSSDKGQEMTNEPAATNTPEPSNEPEESDSTTVEPSEAPEDEGENTDDGNGTTEADDKGAVAILQAIWDTYKDDEKFAAGGGDASNMVNDEAGAYDIGDTAGLDATLGFPASQVENIDGAASLMHMMNANTFTCGAYHLKDKEQAAAIGDELEKNIQSRQWMCGFPDELLIFTVDDYIAAAFGAKEIMDIFKEKVTAVYENAEFLYEEKIQE